MADTGNWMDMEPDGQNKAGGLIVQFKRESKRDAFNSTEKGFPVDIGIDRVYVSQPGEKDNVIFEVNDSHKQRWPQQWQAYQQGREQIGSGRPLDTLYPANPEVVSTLKAMHIHTIEQLANVPDSSPANTFVFKWKQDAQKHLATAQGNRLPKMEQDLAEAQNRNRLLEEQMAKLAAQVAALAGTTETIDPVVEEAPIRRGPGRPPKIREGEAA